jgi:hypothetical protein
MHRAGVRMLAGSDSGVPGVFWGIGLHQEMELLVSAGLSEADVLRAATLGPAEFLAGTDSLGTVEAGKLADLVLLDANPLTDISNTQRISAVVLNGRYLDRDALDAMLADAEAAARLSGGAAEPDAVRYTIIVDGHPKGERRMWQEAPDAWRYEYEGDPYDSYQFPRTERLVLDAGGIPVAMEITGQKAPWSPWEERFEHKDGTFRWSTTIDEGDRPVEGPAYYAALHPVHDTGVLVRALLRQPSGSLTLLPAGEARIESLGERNVMTKQGVRTVRHFGVHGLDLKPTYVWLDQSGATFADEWSVLSGWESAFPELRTATEEALAEYHRVLARSLVPPARERPLAITGARLFDPETHAVRAGTTILIDGNRIAAVGADGSIEVPSGAELIEAAGRMVLPGLWDMHAHHGIPSVYLEMDAPLHLAGGITTARDLGSHTTPILSLQERIDAGEAIGPRLLLAGSSRVRGDDRVACWSEAPPRPRRPSTVSLSWVLSRSRSMDRCRDGSSRKLSSAPPITVSA